MGLGRATVAACALAAAELGSVRSGGGRFPAVRVADGAVATAFTSERHLRIDGRPGDTFAALSRFWPTADGGWVRTHANYPHHRERLLAALGVPDGSVEGIAREIASRRAHEVEAAVYAAGGLAVAVRTPRQWADLTRAQRAHGPADTPEPDSRGAATGMPQGPAAMAQPLVRAERTDTSRPRRFPPLPVGVLLPAAGVRVLDLTRVLAGPVATRTLALLGADVLRVDAPRLPENADAHADTGFGKRSTRLDLGRRADRAVFEDLLAAADVVVTGYRPGALDRYDLSAEALQRRPGLIVAQISAWGTEGSWGRRRGFDSLVQAATGIASVEAGPDGCPGALPAQALDHGTGYLVAGAVLRALTEQYESGYGRLLRFALTATAAWLLNGIPTAAEHGPADFDPSPWLADADSPVGRLRHALPPVSFGGAPRDWSRPPGAWGEDEPVWA
jgi:crotonobetainyl-CoA:carnitine CoA-transferase CaiB-like acyl-CoA transferase